MQEPTASPVGAVLCTAELQINSLPEWPHCAAWVDDKDGSHHLEPTYSPDMADLIDGPEENNIPDEEAIAVMGKIMNQVLEFCFQTGHGKPPNFPLAFRRFCCVVWVLRPKLFSNQALAALAPHLHVTRASLSKIVRTFCKLTGVRNVLI